MSAREAHIRPSGANSITSKDHGFNDKGPLLLPRIDCSGFTSTIPVATAPPYGYCMQDTVTIDSVLRHLCSPKQPSFPLQKLNHATGLNGSVSHTQEYPAGIDHKSVDHRSADHKNVDCNEKFGMGLHSSTNGLNGLEPTQCHAAGNHAANQSIKERNTGTPFAGDQASIPEPLAIIGIAFQFPGGVTTEGGFWEMLVEKTCMSSEYPLERMNVKCFFDPSGKKQNTVHTKRAHFLKDDIYHFDAPFFSISSSDATAMDPCQRTLMETTYRALESAGLTLQSVSGTNTSVHVGCFSSDYMLSAFRDPQDIQKYSATGVSSALLSNRLSWFFNLQGPSLTVDTACSSGMVALDLACQGLWSGQSDIAIIAASNLILSPEINISLSNMNFLSPDGRCFSFDHRANGYARGEGVATLVVTPLSKALAIGVPIRALIRSVCTNQDGRTTGGITQPSQNMQAALIRETYRRANLDMAHTRFFEAHGTGTAIGDPTEANAIGECFRSHRSGCEPLHVGALKSNIGHLEGTSGLAGIIKAVLAIERATIPPNTNFERLNPEIDGEFLRVHFPQESIPWPNSGAIRRASINSFGFGGANAHVVLDDVQSYLQRTRLDGTRTLGNVAIDSTVALKDTLGNGAHNFTPHLLIFSAADKTGISRQTEAHKRFLEDFGLDYTSDFFANYSFTLATGRTGHAWRAFHVLRSPNQFAEVTDLTPIKSPRQASKMNLGAIFTGQGAQWLGMGKELLKSNAFLQSVQKSEECLAALGYMRSLVEFLDAETDASILTQARFSQVLTTVIQIALVDLIEWLEIAPRVVVGHSSGEIAAAYAAGHICRYDAVKVAYYRGLLGSRLEENGGPRYAMAAVGLSKERVLEELEMIHQEYGQSERRSQLVVSCINSPSNVTLSGPEAEVESLVARLTSRAIFARRLKVNLGYHSPQMACISDEYQALIGKMKTRPKGGMTRPLMISSITGEPIDRDTVCTSKYWTQNMVSPVDFLSAIRSCGSSNISDTKSLGVGKVTVPQIHAWLEIGPHAALRGPVREILTLLSAETDIVYTSVLLRYQSALSTMMSAAGYLHCHHIPMNLGRVTGLGLRPEVMNSRTILPNLPPYQFNHSIKYLEDSLVDSNFRNRQHGPHDLLGLRVGDSNPYEAEWRLIIRANEMPWIRDHKVNGSILYPASGMLSMAIEATKQLHSAAPPTAFLLEDVEIPSPIFVASPEGKVEVRIHMSTQDKQSGVHDFRIFVLKPSNDYEVVCYGRVQAEYEQPPSDVDSGRERSQKAASVAQQHESTMKACSHPVVHEWYQTIQETTGLEYGPAFQRLITVRSDNSRNATAILTPYDVEASTQYVVHPAVLDATFQICFATFGAGLKSVTMVPTRIARLWLLLHELRRGHMANDSTRERDPNKSSELTIYLQYMGMISLSGLAHSNQSDARERVTASAENVFQHHASFNIKVISEQSGLTLRLEVDGLELTAISSRQENPRTLCEARNLCSHIEWDVDLDMLENSEVQTYCEDVRATTTPFPATFSESLTKISIQFGREALRLVGNDDICLSMRKYADWLRRRIIELSPQFEELTPDQLHLEIENVLPSVRADLHITIGKQMHLLLQGIVDPLELLFRDQGRMDAFYAEAMQDSSYLKPFSRFLESITHKTPNLRFLEIGAGTGGTTREVLKAIGDNDRGIAFEDYTFTDISPSFLQKARETFSGQLKMSYKVLNIEKDPKPQGFESSAYDVVLADNILHATMNLTDTLANVSKLLKPGGKLILRELTAPERLLTGYVFGLLPGWWRSSERERQDSPCLNISIWDQQLRNSGFSGADIILRDHLDEPYNPQCTFIITTATEAHYDAVESQIQVSPIFVANQLSSALKEQASLVASHISLRESPQTSSLIDISDLVERQPQRHNIILFDDHENSILGNLGETEFHSQKQLLAYSRSLLWVKPYGFHNASGTLQLAMSDGLCRVSRYEYIKPTLVSLSLEGALDSSRSKHVVKLFAVIQEHMQRRSSEVEPEYAEIKGRLCVNRIRTARAHRKPGCPAAGGLQTLRIGIRVPGLLDTMTYYEEGPVSDPLPANEIGVEIKAIGVNYKDLLALLGRAKSDDLGCEYSGIVRSVGKSVTNIKIGDRVALVALDNFKTHTRVKATRAHRIPDRMSFTEAAAIPTAYCTTYYALVHVARLQPGETILIHSAAGGTGQAAVQLAQWIGAEVFATVGDNYKKKLLREVYGIADDHIFYSRDTSFASGIKRILQDGIDVVLNSLPGTLLEASWDCIAPFGRFVEIGLKDAFLGHNLPMDVFLKNVSFSSVDMSLIAKRKGELCKQMLGEVFNLFDQQKLSVGNPLHIYPLGEIEQAFRFLQSCSRRLINTSRFFNGILMTRQVTQGPHSPYQLSENATYIISGGLGAIGLAIARWLVQRGAKHMILLSRTGGDTNSSAMGFMDQMRDIGVEVYSPSCDITNLGTLKSTLARFAKRMPPVRGCIQAAMVLRDATLSSMSLDEWTQAIRPKVEGSWNLHLTMPAGMDFFVMLSSCAGVFGNGGQANYAAGNTYQDALAAYRARIGEKAVSLDIGYVLENGVVANTKAGTDRLTNLHTLRRTTIPEICALLDIYCQPGTIGYRLESQVVLGFEIPADIMAKGEEVEQFMKKPMFRHMFNLQSMDTPHAVSSNRGKTLGLALSEATTPEGATRIVSMALAEKIDVHHSLVAYGIDSLIGLELNNWLLKETGVDVPVLDLLGGASLENIAVGIAQKRKSESTPTKA
ncbi:uncharacterized protein BDR25DRAFT_363876 [Lindgomyces ingoldianus]|uniref:Uncharacterized protein n=1 Tax=Lindgomyces ingoldianus TaxID=673940 RepID=A0ACB6Q882_9PLEO|nr:uncharacterized protein BDR25DRAFT_363876 [Lindgomyces ingoldianus]KAF2462582.1 hypothetical protein BDR25DRAFT_363876 [Lindgomyces ingoldianus]